MVNIRQDLQDNFKIVELTLDSEDIRNDFIALAVYENLFVNDLTISVDFLETKNLLETLNITEGSTLTLKYYSKYSPHITEMRLFNNTLECYKTERVKSQTQGKKVYRMHFVTCEQHRQSNKLVSRSYRDQSSTDIIKSLFNFCETDTQLDITDSDDFINLFTVPNLHPWQAINTLCRDSYKQDSNDYIFYRNSSNFVCKPISELINSTPVEDYIMEQTNINWIRDKAIEYRNIKAYQQDKANFNSLDNINTGLYGSKLHIFDFLTKEHTFIESTGKESNFSSSDNKFIFDSNNYFNRNDLSKYRQDRLEKIYALSEERLILEVRTNTNVTIGDTINISIPTTKVNSMVDPNVAKSKDERITGKYLICKIKHEISLDNSQMIFECIKV